MNEFLPISFCLRIVCEWKTLLFHFGTVNRPQTCMHHRHFTYLLLFRFCFCFFFLRCVQSRCKDIRWLRHELKSKSNHNWISVMLSSLSVLWKKYAERNKKKNERERKRGMVKENVWRHTQTRNELIVYILDPPHITIYNRNHQTARKQSTNGIYSHTPTHTHTLRLTHQSAIVCRWLLFSFFCALHAEWRNQTKIT